MVLLVEELLFEDMRVEILVMQLKEELYKPKILLWLKKRKGLFKVCVLLLFVFAEFVIGLFVLLSLNEDE